MKTPKTVLITGTSRGIGKAIAEDLQRQGLIVYGSSRAGDDSDDKHLALEVTDPASCEAAVDEVVSREGRLDVLINNAGFHLTAASEESSLEEIRQQMDVNFWGVVNMTKAATPQMLKQKNGSLISMTSLPGHVAFPFMSAYCASKFAVEGYMGSLRLELGPFGIKVANIAPGAVKTGTLDHSLRGPSASHELFEKYRKGLHRQMETGIDGSSTVADVVAAVRKVVNAKNPAFSNPVGAMTKRILFLRKFLPAGMIERQLLKIAGLPKQVSY